MARTKTSKKSTKRGSPEAIAKRRNARALNQLFAAGSATDALDGRTLKRKQRLVEELKQGRKGTPLKAVEALTHIHDLLGMGETATSIRRLKPKLPSTPPMSDELADVVRDAQGAYHFDPVAWKLLGINLDALPAR